MSTSFKFHRYFIVLVLLCYWYMLLDVSLRWTILDETTSRATMALFCPQSSFTGDDSGSTNTKNSNSALLFSSYSSSRTLSSIDKSETTTNDIDQSTVPTICHNESSHIPFQQLWEHHIKDAIMNVSFLQAEWSYDLRSRPDFVQWLQESMEYFTIDRLQHTQLSVPIDQQQIMDRVRTIIERKIRHPTIAPPLRIYVFGGSVPKGHGCFDNKFDFMIRRDGKDNSRFSSREFETNLCAWPGRLQEMFDTIFGKEVVEITNMAMGGAKTDMSTAFMEFGVLPIDQLPDIILWDHGINDALQAYHSPTNVVTDTIFHKLQAFYQASIDLPGSSAPLVVLLDTYLGYVSRNAIIAHSLAASAAVSKMLLWYPNIWGISYANTMRPYALSHLTDMDVELPLLASKGITSHPGMMYHITIAWTIVFNFMNAIHENCVSKVLSDTTEEEMKVVNSYLDVEQIPVLTDQLKALNVASEWQDRVTNLQRSNSTAIQYHNQTVAIKSTKYSSFRCYYVWMVNRLLRIKEPEHIQNVLAPYMTQNNGWTSFHDDRKKSPGWVAENGRGSYFELHFENVPETVSSLTIIYMQSYSEKWYNSTLQVDCTLQQDDNTLLSTDATHARSSALQKRQQRYVLSGYHDDPTSILVPIKFLLPTASSTTTTSSPNRKRSNVTTTTSETNRSIRLKFQLVDGITFKIAGMAIC